MNVTATTFPRRSLSDSRELSCVVSVKSGAGPIFDSRASDFAACPVAGMDQPTAMSAAMATTHRARPAPMLALQLLPELVDKPPVGALGNGLFGTRLDHPGIAEPQRIESHGGRRVDGAPIAVRKRPHRLQRPVVTVGVAVVYEKSRSTLGLARADVRRFEERPQRPLGGHWVLPDKVAICCHHAAEGLGPGTVGEGIDEHAADLPLL